MTYEQSRALSATVATRIHDIARELSRQTTREWTATQVHEHYSRFTRADGLALGCSSSWSRTAGSIHVSPDLPDNADGARPYLRDSEKIDGINVGASKSDAQIARDLIRRLVTPYEPLYTRLVAECDATLAVYATARRNAEQVATAIGAQIGRNRNGEDKGAHRHDLIRDNLQNVRDISVDHNGLVEFRITLPIEAAIALLNAQPRRAD